MWPLGDYNRLVHEIKRRENSDIPVTFGLLIADYDQQQCREYILNYIERFNYRSDRYINFYLPGYLEESFYDDSKILVVGDKRHHFNRQIYLDFLIKLETDFSIEYPYTPVLVLMEYSNGNFKFTKRIVIQLDNSGSQIKQTGELFEQIFSIARNEVAISDFSNKLKRGEINRRVFETIVGCIDNKFITSICTNNQAIKKYRLL